jgi:hypothetical protein
MPQHHEINGTFQAVRHLAVDMLLSTLELLACAGRMAAIALELGLAFSRLTVGGAKLLTLCYVAKASIHRTLLCICSHDPISW